MRIKTRKHKIAMNNERLNKNKTLNLKVDINIYTMDLSLLESLNTTPLKERPSTHVYLQYCKLQKRSRQ